VRFVGYLIQVDKRGEMIMVNMAQPEIDYTIVNNRHPQFPNGKTQGKWFTNGYGACAEDIARIILNGESQIDRLNAIREWIEDNSGIRFQD
jgi:hypothetical protein